MRQLNFQDHSRKLGENRYIYAVVSRRAGGLSIGVNLNPDKVCNFDCPYCQVDRSIPGGPAEIDLRRLEEELDHLLQLATGDLWSIAPFDTAAPAHRRVSDIAFAGDGEPTSPPEFSDAAFLVKSLRDRHQLKVPLRLLTNATLLGRERVRPGLEAFDEIWCKLDAGTEAYFQQVDGTKIPFSLVLRNLRELALRRPIVLQCMFLRFRGTGPTTEEQQAWAQRIQEILQDGGQIAEVQVYSVARKPSDPSVEPLSRPELEAIGARLQGVPVKVVA